MTMASCAHTGGQAQEVSAGRCVHGENGGVAAQRQRPQGSNSGSSSAFPSGHDLSLTPKMALPAPHPTHPQPHLDGHAVHDARAQADDGVVHRAPAEGGQGGGRSGAK